MRGIARSYEARRAKQAKTTAYVKINTSLCLSLSLQLLQEKGYLSFRVSQSLSEAVDSGSLSDLVPEPTLTTRVVKWFIWLVEFRGRAHIGAPAREVGSDSMAVR